MENDTIKISKLIEPKQWTTWKFQVTIILKSQDLWNVATGKLKPPVEGATNYTKDLDDYEKKTSPRNVFSSPRWENNR